MDMRPVVWDARNSKHIIADHPERNLTADEVTETMNDPERHQDRDPQHRSYVVTGRTRAGRWLIVAWVSDPRGCYPVHARAAGKRAIRRLQQRRAQA
jgi:hypothetical protein